MRTFKRWLNQWVENFDWDSPEQLKGHISFLHWAKAKGVSARINPIDLFFIQRDHESELYWRELVGGQISDLQDQIHRLDLEIRRINQRLEGKL